MSGGEHSTGRRGSNAVLVGVIAALLGAAVGAGLVYMLLSGQMKDKDDQLDAAAAAEAEQAKQVTDLKAQVGDLMSSVDKFKSQLERQKKQNQKAEQKVKNLEGTDLTDGRYPVNVKAADATPGSETLTVDVIQFLTGDVANKAAKANGDETPVPNDYYVVNESTKLRTLPVASGTDAALLYWHKDLQGLHGKPVSFTTFANVMNGSAQWQHYNQDGIYWITLNKGQVTKIEVQFIP